MPRACRAAMLREMASTRDSSSPPPAVVNDDDPTFTTMRSADAITDRESVIGRLLSRLHGEREQCWERSRERSWEPR